MLTSYIGVSWRWAPFRWASNYRRFEGFVSYVFVVKRLTVKMLSLRCNENSGPTVPVTQRRHCENLKWRNVGVGNFIVTAIRFVSVGQSPVTHGRYLYERTGRSRPVARTVSWRDPWIDHSALSESVEGDVVVLAYLPSCDSCVMVLNMASASAFYRRPLVVSSEKSTNLM